MALKNRFLRCFRLGLSDLMLPELQWDPKGLLLLLLPWVRTDPLPLWGRWARLAPFRR